MYYEISWNGLPFQPFYDFEEGARLILLVTS